ncbi:N-terminal conserved domain of Nudc-domain-containing protein [Baffinella frigidus]|nr:N-terminal conserved domain of Nudc-domain-containing protein [Cryptophyta sp. CCMP2293]
MVLSEEEADALLIQLAQRAGGIVPLLEAVFSFLKRKTDFYHIQRPGDRIGFPEGKRTAPTARPLCSRGARKLVLGAFRKFGDDANAAAPNQKKLEHPLTLPRAPPTERKRRAPRPER